MEKYDWSESLHDLVRDRDLIGWFKSIFESPKDGRMKKNRRDSKNELWSWKINDSLKKKKHKKEDKKINNRKKLKNDSSLEVPQSAKSDGKRQANDDVLQRHNSSSIDVPVDRVSNVSEEEVHERSEAYDVMSSRKQKKKRNYQHPLTSHQSFRRPSRRFDPSSWSGSRKKKSRKWFNNGGRKSMKKPHPLKVRIN